jgi:hemolysin D
VDASLSIQQQRLTTAQKLLRDGTSSRSSFLDVQQTFLQLQNQKEVYRRQLDQQAAQRAELETERQQLVSGRLTTLADRSAQIAARLATLAENRRSAEQKLAATRLLAPVSGTVDQLKVFTVGGVVSADATLMQIVPDSAKLEVESVFSNADIGFMNLGQQANISLDAFPSERFGFIKGVVDNIAADSSEISTGIWGYTVRIAPQTPFLLAFGKERFALRPGMTATVNVITDRRRLISYFFAPILRTLQNAMGER